MFKFIVILLSVFLSAKMVGVYYAGIFSLILFSIILAIINITIKPIINFFTWPINFLTLGLFSLILNVLFLELASYLTPGFFFASIWQTLIFVLILHSIMWIFTRFEISKY